ncbi:MAG: hypothetical protein IJ494_06625 [Bacteroides sp.]|nr:hypothetical protein [Bacteroides sp.]
MAKKRKASSASTSSSSSTLVVILGIVAVVVFLWLSNRGTQSPQPAVTEVSEQKTEQKKEEQSAVKQGQEEPQKPARPTAVTYKHRRNGRYEFGVYYPDFMTESKASENGDGVTFTASDGAVLTAWGTYDVTGESLKERFRTEKKDASYSHIKDNWFVVSRPVAGGKVNYTKTVFRADDDAFLTLSLTYPAKEQKKYEAVIEKIFGSFPR